MSAAKSILPVYNLAMKVALPLLSFNSRLREGWQQRVFRNDLPTPADLWMQAASVGEAFLAWELVNHLENPFANRPLKVLLTTNTKEGLSILTRVAEANESRRDIAIQTAYFPMDAPSIMRRALARVQPKTAVLLESEIWPGFLAACKDRGTEVLLINGRMSTKSLAGYLSWPSFFQDLGPDHIMAMSEKDAMRFATIYGSQRVEAMQNIKFDRLVPKKANEKNPLAPLLGKSPNFAVFGSIRKEEEGHVVEMVEAFQAAKPKTAVGLFPRHLQRVEAWQELLEKRQIPFVLRSETEGEIAPGTLVLWDTIGEMGSAFDLARAVFIGGTLAPVGGQNFLEPLAAGVIPVIGPHWKNFAWVGREIIEKGLVREKSDWKACVDELILLMKRPPARQTNQKNFGKYVSERSGGAAAASKRIADSLTRV